MERRAYPRIKWRFVLRFRKEKSQTCAWEFTTIENISLGGCFFPSTQKLDIGEVLELQIKFPGVREFLIFRGEVKRCEEIREFSSYKIAVEFKDLGEEKREQLKRVICRKM